MQQPQVDAERFWRDGYLLIKGVFSAEEIQEIRQESLRVLEKQEAQNLCEKAGAVTRIRGDLLSHDGLRHLVVDDRVLHIVRTILGGQPVYFGDSNFQIGRGLRGWHKDNRLPDRFIHTAGDWQGRYDVLRVGLYLQDHAVHSGGLGIRAGSHEANPWVRRLEKVPPARLRVMASLSYGQPVAVASEIGDLVVWNLRTTHSGNVVRLKPFPGRKVPTGVENLAPSWLCLPEDERRVAMFLTYGLEGDHLRRYVEYLQDRGYMEPTWQTLRDDASLSEVVRDKDLQLTIPSSA